MSGAAREIYVVYPGKAHFGKNERIEAASLLHTTSVRNAIYPTDLLTKLHFQHAFTMRKTHYAERTYIKHELLYLPLTLENI